MPKASSRDSAPLATTDHQLWTGLYAYFAGRTPFYDWYFETAAAEGCRQLVLVGAGLDARAWRLPLPTGAVVYELDSAQVHNFKSEVLDLITSVSAPGSRFAGEYFNRRSRLSEVPISDPADQLVAEALLFADTGSAAGPFLIAAASRPRPRSTVHGPHRLGGRDRDEVLDPATARSSGPLRACSTALRFPQFAASWG
ncbi:class I SAM-dependent methyltransferase [Streptomyces sp. SID13031]|uniref:class I SAM-dependent methyltransferase n=1 Tax=Streptomyces sp. SID13031 TaxID=2706046 RepID=UPI0019452ED6|nr:class I SAM-dependent methyltransferase [Streptomyces sp. SID13031]